MHASSPLFEAIAGIGPAFEGGPRISDAHLSFVVSSDEEYVGLTMALGSREFHLPDRAHNYLLLTLARRRLDDRTRGIVETSCGWIRHDDLAHDPMMAPPHLNLSVCRIRKQFAAYKFVDPDAVIERRLRSRQLRIGIGALDVQRV
jgi:hypothetical protein